MCEIVYGERPCPNNRSRGAWSHIGVILKDDPGRKFKRHSDSFEHREADKNWGWSKRTRIQEMKGKFQMNCISQS